MVAFHIEITCTVNRSQAANAISYSKPFGLYLFHKNEMFVVGANSI